MFSTVLIANRGEIALRVMRTCADLGIRTVAVYSDADASAAHVRAADTAVRLGPAAASESYLNIDAVIAAAHATGAEAVHPGYGFLSENADFAARCEAENIVFLGPTPGAIRTMGDKISAKQAVAARGVPLVPGVAEAGLDDAALARAAEGIGYPVLVKPSAGGGGKGMRAVFDAAELPAALASARREAAASFGDDTLFLERLVSTPRHIEVQVLADTHGNVIHLGERECSLQRRHQKVVEEAPSALLDADTRAAIGEAAVQTAKSVGYVGAGTVEFIVSADRPGEFFFMEMNTRLQVEHPVTEEVTGVDLVAWQLRIGAGERLPLAQEDVHLTGHAIEARIYAEDPSRGFLPTGGQAIDVVFPLREGIRVDAGLEAGQRIKSDYDPMIAKVIAYGADRAEALARLQAVLAESAVPGIVTNIDFLRTLLARDDVRAGELDTGLIERMSEDELAHEPAAVDAAFAAAALTEGSRGPTRRAWDDPSGWRVGPERVTRVDLAFRGEPVEAEYRHGGVVTGDDGRWHLTDGGVQHTARVFTSEAERTVWVAGRRGIFAFSRPRAESALDAGVAGATVLAPMPGSVIAVAVEEGARVSAGQPIVTVEAMKMEHVLTSPADGVVRLTTVTGAQVALADVLATIVEEDS